MTVDSVSVTVSGPAMTGKSIISKIIIDALTSKGVEITIGEDSEISSAELKDLSDPAEVDRRLSTMKQKNLKVTVTERQASSS